MGEDRSRTTSVGTEVAGERDFFDEIAAAVRMPITLFVESGSSKLHGRGSCYANRLKGLAAVKIPVAALDEKKLCYLCDIGAASLARAVATIDEGPYGDIRARIYSWVSNGSDISNACDAIFRCGTVATTGAVDKRRSMALVPLELIAFAVTLSHYMQGRYRLVGVADDGDDMSTLLDAVRLWEPGTDGHLAWPESALEVARFLRAH